MRLVVNEFISLDGVVQAPGGPDEDVDGGFAHGGWSIPYFDPEAMGSAIGASFDAAEALLFGRRTWAVSADAWPERAGDPFSDRINAMPKWVVSRTLRDADLRWNTRLVAPADPIGAIRELREGDGGDLLVYGSPTLVRALLDAGVVDELNLMIEPMVLGGGKSIFPADGIARGLELMSATATPTGVIMATYRSASAPQAGGVTSDDLVRRMAERDA